MAEGRYQGLLNWVAAKIEEYENMYFRWDKPVPFCGMFVYPAKITDYEIFSACTTCLSLEKNKDPKGISMSYLKYLITKMQDKNSDEGKELSFKLQKLFEIIFHIQNGLKCKDCGHIITYDSDVFKDYIKSIQDMMQNLDPNNPNITVPQLTCPECGKTEFSEMIKIFQDPETKKYSLLVDGHTIKERDFDLLRQIILYQNFPDYADDSYVDENIKADYEARMKLQQEKNDLHASLEKKIVCLSIATNYSFEQIYNMTIRKFSMALSTVDDLINYKIIKSASMSGLVQLPKDFVLEHWIYKKEKDIYGDSYKDLDQVKSEVENV